jgi:hypothetical protein
MNGSAPRAPSDGAPQPYRCVAAEVRPRFGARGEEALHREAAHARLASADVLRDE